MLATDLLLKVDIRNNSAWHHRFFVSFASGAQRDVTQRELAFVKAKISLAPNNLSAWNYLRGVLDKMGIRYAELRTFVEPYTTPPPSPRGQAEAGKREQGGRDTRGETEVEVYDLDNPRPSLGADLPCALAIEFLADLCEQERENDKASEVSLTR